MEEGDASDLRSAFEKREDGKRELTIDLKIPSMLLYRLRGVSISTSSPKSMTARRGRG